MELRALGPVRWLVVPNCWHHLGAPAAADYFPEARVVGPASALERNRALKIHVDIHDAQFGEQWFERTELPENWTLYLRKGADVEHRSYPR